MLLRRVVCASARAFVSPTKGGGGNPVSIFHSSQPTTSDERIKLAQTCEWESIVIENNSGSSNESPPTFYFYMPSGEEVSFCGHAAIGACSFLANKKSLIDHENNLQSYSPLSEEKTVPFLADDGLKYNAKVIGNEVELVMNVQHVETECNPQSCPLESLLAEIGLTLNDVPSNSEESIHWPKCINSSVARPKTLIPIATTERLHAATPPQNPDTFRKMCDSIHSTGIYLYSTFTKKEMEDAATEGRNVTFECRQFPRSSGYPEDPATGIAAGALAASLYKGQITPSNNAVSDESIYDVHQGTSMGRPSKISVKISDYALEEANPSLKVSYTGSVVFDSLTWSGLE